MKSCAEESWSDSDDKGLEPGPRTSADSDDDHVEELLVILCLIVGDGRRAAGEVVVVQLQIIANNYHLSVHKGMTAFSKVKASEATTIDAICQDSISQKST